MLRRAMRWTAVAVFAVGVVGINVAIVVYHAAQLPDLRQAEGMHSIDDLIQQLADADADRRRLAAKDLCTHGSEARAAAPRLRQLLDDADGRVRVRAATALWC